MNSITVSREKTLKLTNVLIKDVQGDELQEFELIVEKMNNFIKVKGVQQLGPLVQYVKGAVNDEGQLEMKISLLQQTNQLIHHLEQDYRTDSLIRIKNCLYCRYMGPEEKLKFAYDKLNLIAFEEDIKLKGDSYTIFVNQEEDNIVADVFMERMENE